MNVRKIALGLMALAAIFLSYDYLHPLEIGSPLEDTDYSFQIDNVSKDNKWSAFEEKGGSMFFIHPGENKPVVGIFRFKQSKNIILKLSVNDSGLTGDIKFTTVHNGEVISKDFVTRQTPAKVNIFVTRGDDVRVIANKHGDSKYDHGALRIKTTDYPSLIRDLVVPFLWSVLIIYLIGMGYFYLAVNSYLIFFLALLAEKINFGPLSFHSTQAYMIFSFAITFAFISLYQEFSKFWRGRIPTIICYILTIFALIIPLCFVIYTLNFEAKISRDILYAVFQSNTSEALEYLIDFVSLKFVGAFFFTFLLVAFLFYAQERKERLIIQRSFLFLVLVIFTGLSFTHISHSKMAFFVAESAQDYGQELASFKSIQEKRKAGKIVFNASKQAKGETYIVVIGESLSKKHMGIYGYVRDTTPLLERMNIEEELIVFSNTYSNHTHTVPVLQLGLTEANQYNEKTYYDSLSIIEILKAADIETHWLTNQLIYGPFDSMVSVIATAADNLVALNSSIGMLAKTQQFDEVLIDEVGKILAEDSQKNRVIFVHMMGNHNTYESRYPTKTYTKFSGELDQGEFGEIASKIDLINQYDNSVLYTDFVVASILNELQKEQGVTGFLFLPDHGEDVIAERGHLSGKFTHEMTEIPMLTWLSAEYKAKYRNNYENLLSRTETLYSNDMLYDTLIGFIGIHTEKYDALYDLSSDSYQLIPENALVLNGSLRHAGAGNYSFWQKENAKFLVASNQDSRVFPHRVNSVGKLKEIWRDGFRSFEVDVRFGDAGSATFQVGHHPGLMGFGLEAFLESVDHSQIERIWLDFKNLSSRNHQDALDRLNTLDQKYNLKSKLIVESGTNGDFFKSFGTAGWHTSYYLPTSLIVQLLKEEKTNDLKSLASDILGQIERQNVDAVSFDNRLYPFVSEYLGPKISTKIVYHAWYGPALADKDFQKKLLKNGLYLDKRVKTLLFTYKSQFHL